MLLGAAQAAGYPEKHVEGGEGDGEAAHPGAEGVVHQKVADPVVSRRVQGDQGEADNARRLAPQQVKDDGCPREYEEYGGDADLGQGNGRVQLLVPEGEQYERASPGKEGEPAPVADRHQEQYAHVQQQHVGQEYALVRQAVLQEDGSGEPAEYGQYGHSDGVVAQGGRGTGHGDQDEGPESDLGRDQVVQGKGTVDRQVQDGQAPAGYRLGPHGVAPPPVLAGAQQDASARQAQDDPLRFAQPAVVDGQADEECDAEDQGDDADAGQPVAPQQPLPVPAGDEIGAAAVAAGTGSPGRSHWLTGGYGRRRGGCRGGRHCMGVCGWLPRRYGLLWSRGGAGMDLLRRLARSARGRPLPLQGIQPHRQLGELDGHSADGGPKLTHLLPGRPSTAGVRCAGVRGRGTRHTGCGRLRRATPRTVTVGDLEIAATARAGHSPPPEIRSNRINITAEPRSMGKAITPPDECSSRPE